MYSMTVFISQSDFIAKTDGGLFLTNNNFIPTDNTNTNFVPTTTLPNSSSASNSNTYIIVGAAGLMLLLIIMKR